ncbi:MAG TPA: sugar transferase [Terriglobales bacterium]|nr:sugar transferase [Terriglobales bacterium]
MGDSHDIASVRDGVGKVPMHAATLSKRHGHERVLKGVIDIFGSFVMVILLSPLILLLWLLVWLVDGSPVIYRRRVVGVCGEFDAYKFRTMHRDADAMLAANPALHNAFRRNFKLKSDPRVTHLGTWLRKYSLDELPQLFNVLRGQMSLVGPRMISAAELQRYGSYKGLLLSVKPGVTGYWQVRGRQDLSYTERIRMDVHYITNWSLALDLMILLQTPAKVLRSEGAY